VLAATRLVVYFLTRAKKGKSELEVQGVVDVFIKALMTGTRPRHGTVCLRRICEPPRNLPDRLAIRSWCDTVASDHKQAGDCARWWWAISREPERLESGLEAHQEGERSTANQNLRKFGRT